MKIDTFKNAVARACSRSMLKINKNAPQILVGAGIVGSIGAVVVACVATTKLPKVLEEHKEQKEEIQALPEGNDISKLESKLYVKTGLKIAGLYAPAAALEFLSLAAIISAHISLQKRNAGLAAAYTAVDKAFKNYRKGVIDRFGEDIDKELRLGVKEIEVEETETDDKGKEKKVKKKVRVLDPDDPSTYGPYTKVFDESCNGWTKDPEANMAFLKTQQSVFNDKLRLNGHVWLNDVYEALGIPKTKSGQVVGWIYDEENPIGDNYIDFGLYDIRRSKVRDFINGYERCIILDFNVDGNIWELMK